MKTDTKYFGPLEYEEDDVLEFPRGLFGFEEERRFLLLPFAGSNGTMLSLQSLTTPPLAFVLLDARSLVPDYAPALAPEDLELLNVPESGAAYYYLMCVVNDPVSASTVNLRCPVAVNEETGVSVQAILDDDSLGMRCPLSEFGTEKGDGSC